MDGAIVMVGMAATDIAVGMDIAVVTDTGGYGGRGGYVGGGTPGG